MKQILIDKITVPKAAVAEFIDRMNINRALIKTLPGFIEDTVYQSNGDDDILTFITVALWETEEAILNAKNAVQAEYKREGFDMPAMLKRTGINIDRGIYHQLHEAG
nr:antibiotic biosynthesis monooxygenase [uncultured Mucilaginibacter sp.]